MSIKLGIAGMGAIGKVVARAVMDGIPNFDLVAASDVAPCGTFDIPYVSFEELAQTCDLIVEALPPPAVPDLMAHVCAYNKDVIAVSSSALIIYPSIFEVHKGSNSRIYVPSGALSGIDGVYALKQMGIKSAMITTTKPPRGFAGAPFIVEQSIDLDGLGEKTKLFGGYAVEAAKAFPANVNVAATLSLAGIGADKTWVEVWADPAALGNAHEIKVIGGYSTITAKVENTPDPQNPKSSMLTAYSVIALLKNLQEPLAIF